MSSLDKLVPVLDGTNWREWEVTMTAFLQMQELWEVVSENTKPIEPEEPEGETNAADLAAYNAALAAYNAALAIWKKENSKAQGIITLRVAAHLRHHILESAHQTWTTLRRTFGAPPVSALYADFKHILAAKLSGGNPIPEIERLATLLGRLNNTPLQLSETLQAMILLAALPPKWDSVAQLYLSAHKPCHYPHVPERQKSDHPGVRTPWSAFRPKCEQTLCGETQGSRPRSSSAAAAGRPSNSLAPPHSSSILPRRKRRGSVVVRRRRRGRRDVLRSSSKATPISHGLLRLWR